MILIDSLYVNRSGSKHLFYCLVQNLIESKSDIFYLIDSRNQSDFSMIPSSKKKILNANIFSRFLFYLTNKKKFKKIFCFSGVPSLLKSSKVTYYNYFHNVILITDRYKNIFSFLKYNYIKLFKNNVDFWIVQTDYTCNLLIDEIKVNRNNVLILPFFSVYKLSNRLDVCKYNFIYVSDAYEHKNHQRLFEAFFNLSKIYPEINLTVTIDEK